MQVDLFLANGVDDSCPAMLVMPSDHQPTIPDDLQSWDWRHVASVEASDPMVGFKEEVVEFILTTDGFLLTTPNLSEN